MSHDDPPDPSEDAPHEERTYSGDMVLLVLFVAIACVVGVLLFASRQAGAIEHGAVVLLERR